jgi:hypothetical protein
MAHGTVNPQSEQEAKALADANKRKMEAYVNTLYQNKRAALVGPGAEGSSSSNKHSRASPTTVGPFSPPNW